MGTSDIAGKARRLDGWLGARFDELRRRKYRLEAIYCETRAERARTRGDLSTAADYYERAITLRGRLGDREASIELGTELGEVARTRGDLETARKQFERVAELHSRRENAAGALDAIERILEIAGQQGDDDGLSEWWGHALMVLGRADPNEIDEARREELLFEYADQIYSEDSVARIYGFALEKFVADTAEQSSTSSRTWSDDDEAAADRLLDAAWERREVVREQVDVFRLVLAAGVARVAHAELTGREVDREAALDFVADHREKLSLAADALFERLRDGATDADPETFRADFDPDEPADLRTLEGEAFGRFLEAL